jgi:hypothetical protein
MEKEERKKKLTLMREEPPHGRGQTPFPERRCSMAEERSLQEGKRRLSTIKEVRIEKS